MSDPEQPHADRDPYSTLGVAADATDQEITRAYRRLARAYHPDTNSDAAGDAFAGLTDAYDVLRDPDRRRRYDRTRDTRSAAARAAAAIRIPVRTTEPERRKPSPDSEPRTSHSAEAELTLTFDQAALGTTATVTLTTDETCQTCAGRGIRASTCACPECDGRGATIRVSGGITVRTACARCDGTGQGRPASCGTCAGRGLATTSREFTVRVPAGVEDGDRLQLPSASGAPESVAAIVRVAAHPLFGRHGPDLTMRVPITLAEAALGAVLAVPTLDGAVAIGIPAGTSHGRVLRVAGRGIPHSTGVGDLLVTVVIDVPAKLNDLQRSALEVYAGATASPRSHLEGHTRAVTTDHPRGRREQAP